MHYPKVLERVDFPEQIFHRSFSLGAPDSFSDHEVLVLVLHHVIRHEMSSTLHTWSFVPGVFLSVYSHGQKMRG